MSRGQQREHDQPSARSIILRFVPYMRKRWKLMAGSSTAMFVEVGLRLLEPWPLKFIFDATLHKAGVETTGVAWLDRFSPLTFLTFCAASLVVIVAARAWAAYLRRVGFALAGNLVLTDVRADLFAHIQRLSLSFHSKRRTGDLATRLTSDIGRLQEVVSTAVLPLAAHILTVLGVAVVMLLLEWRLALVAFATLPLFWMSTKRLGKQIRSTARRERQRHGEMGAIATEAIGAIGVVQSLGGEDTHNSRFGARNLSSLKEGVRGKRLSAQLLGAADVFIALGTAILLWAGAWLVMKGELQLTTLLVFFFYHKNMTRPIRNVTKYSGRTAKALASAERIVEILDTVPLIVDTPHATDAPETVSSISFSHVSFGYEPEQTAVEDVSFEARVGAATVFVGPSGAGKSTLMNLLLRLYDPSKGTIAADGQDIHRFRVASWRSRIAVVPQEAMLFATTVRDNITAGQHGLSDAQIMEAATLACAHEFIARLPEGYDTVVGERGATLSQGQRQRIAIARALVRRAPIIVLDEPTASLDRQNTDDIVRAIRNLAKEHVCFVITHDLRTVAPDDQVVYMQSGTIRERGSHEELVARGGKYTGAFVDNETAAAACEVSDA